MKFPLRLRRNKDSEAEGVAAVEFAVVMSVFLMLLLGIVEFGYDWYLKHAVTNACRDGARHGVMYRTNPADSTKQLAPSALSAPNRIEDIVNSYLNQALPSGATWTVACTGDGYTSENGLDPTDPSKKLPLVVTVTTTKTWSALSGMIPSMSPMTVTAQTTMLRE